VVGALTARGLAVVWTDYLWFDSLDLASVWSTLVLTRVVIVIIAALVAFAVIFTNLQLVDRLSPRRPVFGTPQDEVVVRFQEFIGTRAGRIYALVAAIFGLLIGLAASGWWERALLFLNAENFGQVDPVFSRDIGFFVFTVPFYRDVLSWAFQLLIWTIILVAILHYLNGGIQIQQRIQRVESGVKLHLSILLAALALLKAAGYWLDRYDLLFSSRGAVFGATFTDLNAQRPALELLVGISVIAAVLLLVNIRFRGWTLPIVAGGMWLATSIIVGGIIPAAVQRLSVEPNEIDRESRYISRNIEFTRDAYGLSSIELREFAASDALVAEDIVENLDTIENIRLWDPGVLRTTYTQLEQLRPYYAFSDVDVDRYTIDGEVTQVMLSAREIDVGNLVEESNWVNERLVFTHGFGAVLSPANAVTRQGQPSFLVNDIPPRFATSDLRLDQPRVYFGEMPRSQNFVLVGTEEREVDAVTPEGTVSFNQYDGSGGVAVGSFLRRAALALRFNDFNTLISGRVTGESRALLFRNLTDRVEKAAPFLSQDADPYLVFDDGRLMWIVDMYTTTDRYPYSTPAEAADAFGGTSRLTPLANTMPNGFNYVRNSVKAVVDAYTGALDFYVIDPDDPVLAAYRKIFPELFSDFSEMPAGLVDNLRYPEDLFRVQTDMYAAYHVTDPVTFFNEGDLWQIARDPSSRTSVLANEPLRLAVPQQAARPMLPYYLLITLPGDDHASFLIMQPFTPLATPNMVGFLVAKGDPGSYGEMIQYQFPLGNPPDGPNQVGGRINQDPVIAPDFTLLDQEGSELVKGNMLVIPVEESLLYVQPVYVQGTEQNALPELKKVVVVYEEKIRMRDSLAQAIDAIFNTELAGDQPPDQQPIEGTVEELLAEADRAFAEAEQALRDGDLATYAARVARAQELIAEALRLIQADSSG
jgi:uncharacterized membrane protein (UPF0182 family)